MAISARMQALLKKVAATEAQHLAELRNLGKAQSAARHKATEKLRDNMKRARAAQAKNKKKLKSPSPAHQKRSAGLLGSVTHEVLPIPSYRRISVSTR